MVPITGFGMIAVNNWVVLDAPEPNANVIAHVRGLVVQAGQAGASWYTSSSIVFEGPRYVFFFPNIMYLRVLSFFNNSYI